MNEVDVFEHTVYLRGRPRLLYFARIINSVGRAESTNQFKIIHINITTMTQQEGKNDIIADENTPFIRSAAGVAAFAKAAVRDVRTGIIHCRHFSVG